MSLPRIGWTSSVLNVPSPSTSDRGDAGINKHYHSEGLSILGIFLSDGQSWCHVFQHRQTVSSATFVAAMELFFQWLGGNEGIEDNSLLFMNGATAHTANASQHHMSQHMVEVGRALLGKSN